MDESNIEVYMFLLAVIAAALLIMYVTRRGWLRHEPRRTESGYTWLAIIGPSNAESTEDTYKGAYLLLAAGLRMELMMAELFHERGPYVVARPRVTERTTYSTEVFRPYAREIRSLEDFGRYAPYRDDRMMKLSVHPEDADEAVRVLEDTGLTVERPPGKHWWH